MLQSQDTESTNQDISASDSNIFIPQSILNSVCNDWNINDAEGLALPGGAGSQDKELNFGSFQYCSTLPNSFPDPSWNMGFQFGGSQYVPSACCLLDQQTKKQPDCMPPITLGDIEPFLNKEIENRPMDYGLMTGKQGSSSNSGDCRLLSCMQPQQPINLPLYTSTFPAQDPSLMQFNSTNTNGYNLCLESDCFDKLYSPSRNQYSASSLEQSLEITNMRTEESFVRASDCNLDLSFSPLNDSDEVILNVMESDEESDIIVEDSDTESEVSIDVGPYISDKEVHKEAVMKCFVCNLSYSEKVDFVQVNSSFPLTFISQTPVMLKLIEIIPTDMQTSVKFENNLICKRCLNLIDTVENLEVRLVSVKRALCDFVSRSSKDACDEDWSLLQGSNDIGIEDNIVKHLEPLISKEVTNLTSAEKTETMNKVDYNLNINMNNNDSNNDENAILIGSISNTNFDENIGQSVSVRNTDETVMLDIGKDHGCGDPPDKLIPNGNIGGNDPNINESIKTQHLDCNIEKSGSLKETEIKEVENVRYVLDGEYQCDRCGKIYKREKQLTVHLKKHLGEFTERCADCGKGFMKKSNLELHLRKHRNNICVNCTASFLSDIELRDHLKICSRNKVSCPDCKQVFNSEEKMKSHQEKKHRSDSKVCKVCNKYFKHPSNLVAHLKSHSNEKPFSCEKCGNNYKNQNHLTRHKKKCLENPLKCLTCQKVFSNLLELKTHSKIHKEGVKCDVCSKIIAKSHVRDHMKMHQNNSRKKECPICKKLISSNIKVHMSKHAETKEFKCELCSVEFTFRHSLTKHMRLKHKI